MDRLFLFFSFFPFWLPRTRGDGPVQRVVGKTVFTAPPHARGWTDVSGRNLVSSKGSPARAGMDPDCTHLAWSWSWLPRTRGDGPSSRTRARREIAAPPHARGWTRRGGTVLQGRAGSPARAGMDPSGPPSRDRCPRLPRTRGDGPRPGTCPGGTRPAPPHARGWTPTCPVRLTQDRGSPARAGMDPPDRCGGTARAWLPRTRGDGPASAVTGSYASRAPPHARGWTRGRGGSAGITRGSPARAGMDRSPARPWPGSLRLPRTRGDGPPTYTSGFFWVGGSPARAGMDP